MNETENNFFLHDETVPNCAGVRRKAGCSQASGTDFKIDAQTRIERFRVSSRAFEMKLVCHANRDYSISVCVEPTPADGIQFRLRNVQREEIYNNKNHNMATHTEFTSPEKATYVWIDVTPGAMPSDKGKEVCMIVYIEQRASRKS